MRRWLVSCLMAALACASIGAEQPAGQQDRRNRMFPELVVESGGRQGTCDVLAFTGDGQQLVAVGDDKVVRVWPYRDGQLDRPSSALRWSVWREQRGAIYALAVSPDPQGQRVAIGGLGPYPTTVAVLDRQSGEVLHTVFAIDPKQKELFFGSVRALAFSPRGDRVAFGSSDGSVWLWQPESKRSDALRRLGPRVAPRRGTINRIRLVRFLDENRLLSVSQKGQVLEWDLTGNPSEPRELALLEGTGGSVFEVRVSADGKWLAATAAAKPLVAVRSLDGRQQKDIALVAPQVAVSLAFAANGQRLAVGIRSHVPNEHKFILEGDDRIRVYDLSAEEPAIDKELPHSWRVDCLAFHPDGKHLAVAGGDNHEVTLWDLDQPKKPVRVLSGAGTGLWSVALSKDGRSLAFQTQRDPNAVHPNHRGRGAWSVFDLRMRRFLQDTSGFAPPAPLEELDGWRIVPSPNPFVWKVRHAETGIEHALPLNKDAELMPRCFAFLPREQGQPVRVAVGHYYGVSVYEVRPKGVRRIWVGVGHQGEVMALAVSARGDWLVSASNDQTISAWNLNDWPSGCELGARFRNKGGRVFIDKVDLFSPAWEAGLVEKDEVVQLMVGPKLVFRRPNAGGTGPASGSADNCMDELAAPESGQALNFRILREGSEKPVQKLSLVRRRPLWRFFPTRRNEWVLWMWGHHYYDTSTNGDSFLGWQINRGVNGEKTPSFYKAERFREVFQQELVIDRLLATRDPLTALKEIEGGLQPPRIGDIEATVVRVEPRVQRVKDADVKVTLTIDPQTGNDDYAPQRAELWVNDHRLKVWSLNGKALRTTLTIERKSLRAGDNTLVLQCYNNMQGRGRGRLEEVAHIHCDRVVGQRNLYGLVVGVSDYTRSAAGENGKPLLHDLPTAHRDAEAIRQACLDQKGLLYKNVEVESLPNNKALADRVTILKKLKELAAKAGPDDQVFVFFAGHGEVLKREGKSSFVFCCADFDLAKVDQTSLNARELQEGLADIPCRKIVFLDTCRSGHIAGQPVRDLTPGGRGPIILAACDRGESSYEIKGQPHALFATAILEAAGAGFRRADRNGDNQLDPQELFDYTFHRVPELLKIFGAKRSQTPSCFPPELEHYPLVRQKTPAGK